ncbi:MAG: hypothetical protein QF662_02935, partial [Phycisphaerae bacterium]|nr:hypothetical protein [Phycisphaerae bacterium]
PAECLKIKSIANDLEFEAPRPPDVLPHFMSHIPQSEPQHPLPAEEKNNEDQMAVAFDWNGMLCRACGCLFLAACIREDRGNQT